MHGRITWHGHHGHGHAYNFEKPPSGNKMEVDPAVRAMCERKRKAVWCCADDSRISSTVFSCKSNVYCWWYVLQPPGPTLTVCTGLTASCPCPALLYHHTRHQHRQPAWVTHTHSSVRPSHYNVTDKLPDREWLRLWLINKTLVSEFQTK